MCELPVCTEAESAAGSLVWPDGLKYIGELRNNMQEGLGRLEFPDGSTYEGQVPLAACLCVSVEARWQVDSEMARASSLGLMDPFTMAVGKAASGMGRAS